MPREPTNPSEINRLRAVARQEVERRSLRSVAEEIGITHPTLRDFIRTDKPRVPYGETRRLLRLWAFTLEMPAERSMAASSIAAERVPPWGSSQALIKPRVPPRAYQLVFEYCERLERAGVPEEQIDEARRLMSGETFNTLRKHMLDERTEEGWVKDVKAAWAFIRDTLKAQGFDL